MNLVRLEAQLTGEEGRRHESYLDTENLWTIGIGHHDSTIGPGQFWDDAKIDATFALDVAQKIEQIAQALPWSAKLDDARLAVLIEMAFQMGIGHAPDPARGIKGEKLLAFQHTLASVRDERWEDASAGMQASLWAKQTPDRAHRMARQMATGEWQS